MISPLRTYGVIYNTFLNEMAWMNKVCTSACLRLCMQLMQGLMKSNLCSGRIWGLLWLNQSCSLWSCTDQGGWDQTISKGRLIMFLSNMQTFYYQIAIVNQRSIQIRPSQYHGNPWCTCVFGAIAAHCWHSASPGKLCQPIRVTLLNDTWHCLLSWVACDLYSMTIFLDSLLYIIILWI